MSNSTAGRLAIMGAVSMTGMLFGVVANWATDLAKFQNPRNMNPFSSDPEAAKHARANWISAWLKGGGAGFLSDFLFNEVNPGIGQTAGTYLMGPQFTDLDLTGRITSNLLKGDEANASGDSGFQRAGVEGVQLLKGNTPGATLPYVRGALDRYVFNALIEQIDPNYLQAMKARQQSQQGTTYFADPDAQAGLDGSHWDRPDIGTAWAQ